MVVRNGLGRGLSGAQRGFLVSGPSQISKGGETWDQCFRRGDLIGREHDEDGWGGWMRGA